LHNARTCCHSASIREAASEQRETVVSNDERDGTERGEVYGEGGENNVFNARLFIREKQRDYMMTMKLHESVVY
jgi:hypothetical protein